MAERTLEAFEPHWKFSEEFEPLDAMLFEVFALPLLQKRAGAAETLNAYELLPLFHIEGGQCCQATQTTPF